MKVGNNRDAMRPGPITAMTLVSNSYQAMLHFGSLYNMPLYSTQLPLYSTQQSLGHFDEPDYISIADVLANVFVLYIMMVWRFTFFSTVVELFGVLRK